MSLHRSPKAGGPSALFVTIERRRRAYSTVTVADPNLAKSGRGGATIDKLDDRAGEKIARLIDATRRNTMLEADRSRPLHRCPFPVEWHRS